MGIMPDFLVAKRETGSIKIGLLEYESGRWLAKPLMKISPTSFGMIDLEVGETRYLTADGRPCCDVTWIEGEKGAAKHE